MKITTILKDIFLALASTLLFGGGIGLVGVCIFDARISTMLHIFLTALSPCHNKWWMEIACPFILNQLSQEREIVGS